MKNNHFNWDYALEGVNVNEFLSGGTSLWGKNQGFDNVGRQHWLSYVQALSRPIKICELGFGGGVDFQLLKDAGELSSIDMYGLDVTMKFCQHAALKFPEIKVTHINGEDIPFADKFFDVFYMRHVLEHQKNYRWQLREAFRVTAKEMVINFFLPLTDAMVDEIKFDNIFYHNQYSKPLFEKFCNKYGWEIVSDTNHVTHIDDVEYTDEVVILRRS